MQASMETRRSHHYIILTTLQLNKEENQASNHEDMDRNIKPGENTIQDLLPLPLISLTTCYVQQLNYDIGNKLGYFYITCHIHKIDIEVLTNLSLV